MTLELLDFEGPLTHLLPHYEPRKEQKEMLKTVESAYNNSEIALIEAGTGIGKSIAYLIPALKWATETGERTVISTHTIALQQQLLNKDLPTLRKALNCDIKAVLVKGMSNYICLRKLEESKHEFLLLPEEEKGQFEKIEQWAYQTADGSRTDLNFLPKSKVWESVCAEADTCTFRKCPHFDHCHLMKARENAKDAKIIIVNHSLLMADLSIRLTDENYDEHALLPPYKHLIIDEAHHIEEVATKSFARKAGEIQMRRTLMRVGSDRAGKLSIIGDQLSRLKKKIPPELIAQRSDLLVDIVNAFAAYHTLFDVLEKEDKVRIQASIQKDPVWKEEVIPLTSQLHAQMNTYQAAMHNFEQELQTIDSESFREKTSGPRKEITAMIVRLQEAVSLLQYLATNPPSPDKVPWIERRIFKKTQAIDLYEAELDISKLLSSALFQPFSSLVLCSATLTSNNKFNFFRKQTGLDLTDKPITEKIFFSPFDYENQGVFLIPNDIPLPSHPSFLSDANALMLKTILSARTGTFILFTSYSMLTKTYSALLDPLTKAGFTLLKQGDGNRHDLLSRFRNEKNCVLFGTDSFWEGVDVAGEALEFVIITKLPFRVPTEPVIQARSELIDQQGGSAFFDYSLPQAIVKFKQGAGRLIRNKKDHGYVLCLDSRILQKNYGKQFLKSLPPFKQVSVPSEEIVKEIQKFKKRQ
ncbi:MAG: helicase C-terminal domain-containing protein [Waddliaceae bacterium]